LFTAICYRVGLAQWRLEIGDEIPIRERGHPRSLIDIMRDVHLAFEAAIQRDPANWFWVHNRWKTPGREPKAAQRPSPEITRVEDGG
jgi:KDO2-lipid IV(A) lauroyltransferase